MGEAGLDLGFDVGCEGGGVSKRRKQRCIFCSILESVNFGAG